tara:strand:+ start:1521 stop:2912 length:1392 start_codon:yes stop_codon:yes gene_type:complete
MNNKKNRYASRYNLGGKRMYQTGGAKQDYRKSNLLKAVPNKEAYDALSDIDKKGFDAAAKKAGFPIKKSKYQSGGMYGNNQIPTGLGSTAMTVYQESDPALQEQREESLENEIKEAEDKNTAITQELAADAEQNKETLQTQELLREQNNAAVSSTIKSGIELGKQSGVIDKKAGSFGIGEGLAAYKNVKAAKDTMKTVESFNTAKTAFNVSQRLKQGEQAYKLAQGMKNVKDITSAGIETAGTLGKGVSLAGTSGSAFGTGTSMAGTTLKGAQLGTTLAKDGTLAATEATKAAASGSAAGAGLSALNNANVYALAANYAGKGIKSLADDDDATTWTAGEGIGDTLSKAGEYAGYGAMLGSVVPGVGNVAGAVVGGVVGTGVGLYQGLTGRNKARDEEEKLEAEYATKVKNYNEELTENYAMQKGSIRAGNLKQKTYSGYDLGRNVVAQMGGMRMGIPRYNRAA